MNGGVAGSQSGPSQGRRSRASGDGRLRARDLPDAAQQVRAALAAGDIEKATRLVDRARGVFESTRPSIKSEDIADWRILDAKIQLQLKRYEAAGLAAMKVVILQPDSPRVAEGLCLTGEAYEGLGRPEKAASLFRECMNTKRVDPEVRRRAEAGLARLKGKVPSK
ncbi:MAG: hypothetical protein DCC65_01645 [Planctomycetota bacterium]|nr:MAG: hypothetical protein DCC65_01645 [Planctomycetota bacterium]